MEGWTQRNNLVQYNWNDPNYLMCKQYLWKWIKVVFSNDCIMRLRTIEQSHDKKKKYNGAILSLGKASDDAIVNAPHLVIRFKQARVFEDRCPLFLAICHFIFQSYGQGYALTSYSQTEQCYGCSNNVLIRVFHVWDYSSYFISNDKEIIYL